MHARTPLVLGAALALLAAPAAAQQQQRYPSSFTPRLAERPAVRDALAWIEGNFPRQVEEWIRITEIPGTSRHEQARAAYVREQMEAAGLEVAVDSIGNVVGRRRGTGGGPTVALAAHLDTVHPLDTDVKVRRDGDVLRAPGIFDNSASLANMLAVARALNQAGARTRGDLLFIGTAQEQRAPRHADGAAAGAEHGGGAVGRRQRGHDAGR
ncbi:MAG: M20/M25/M40 family metallo-hydrolase [Gemmatimonadota bacterium]